MFAEFPPAADSADVLCVTWRYSHCPRVLNASARPRPVFRRRDRACRSPRPSLCGAGQSTAPHSYFIHRGEFLDRLRFLARQLRSRERGDQTGALHRQQRCAVQAGGVFRPAYLDHGGHDIDQVSRLRLELALALLGNGGGPMRDQGVRVVVYFWTATNRLWRNRSTDAPSLASG